MSTKVAHRCEDCGYTTKFTSRAQADYALRRHSCDRWRELAEKQARYLARDAAVDRTPKPCLHPRAKHQHGDRATYVLDRCRCLPCAAAASEYEARRLRERAYGRGNYVDAGPAREHVRGLMNAGMGARRISEVSGIDHNVLTKLIWGEPSRGQKPSARMRKGNAEALLAVELDLAGGARRDSTGTARRIQALIAAGWTGQYLAGRLSVLRSNFTPLMHGTRAVTVATEQKVRRLYDELWNAAPPEATPTQRATATRARRYAAARGWVGALAWDDDTIDDPLAEPDFGTADRIGIDEAAVERRVAGDRDVQLNNAERREVVRRLHEAGLTDRDIERRTGISDRQVLRDRRRLGLPANDQRRASA